MSKTSIYDTYRQIILLDREQLFSKYQPTDPEELIGDTKEIHIAITIYINDQLELRRYHLRLVSSFLLLGVLLCVTPFILLLLNCSNITVGTVDLLLAACMLTVGFSFFTLGFKIGSGRAFDLFFKNLEPDDIFTVAAMKEFGPYSMRRNHSAPSKALEIFENLVNKYDEDCARPWTIQETQSMCNWLFLSRNKQDIALELKILTLLGKYGNADIFEKRLRKVLQSWLVWRRDQKTYYEMQNCLKALVDKR